MLDLSKKAMIFFFCFLHFGLVFSGWWLAWIHSKLNLWVFKLILMRRWENGQRKLRIWIQI